MLHVPHVSEHSGREKIECDIFSRLLNDRVIILNGEIRDEIVPVIYSQLLYLDARDSRRPVYLYINSPGGSVTSGLAIYDTMRFIEAPIATVCIGDCMSMGAFLLASGTKGLRCSLPHGQILIHQPSGGCAGQVTDIEIQARQFSNHKRILSDLLALHTGQTQAKIEEMTERDTFLTAEEAVEIGLIDRVIDSKENARSLLHDFTAQSRTK